MKEEKVHQEKAARTIQQMAVNGMAQFVDNRSSFVTSAVQRVGMEDEENALQGKFKETVQLFFFLYLL